MMFRRRGTKIKPLPRVQSIYGPGDLYPGAVLLPMSNGRIVRYDLGYILPRPQVGPNGWAKTGRQRVGYRLKRWKEV